MSRALAGLDADELACERILDALDAMLRPEAGTARGIRRWTASLLGFRRLLRLVEERIPGAANYRPYLAHMFPDIDRVEVEQRCRQMAACLGLERVPEVRQLEVNVFRLDPA